MHVEYFSSLPHLDEEDMLDLGDSHTSLIDGFFKILSKVDDVYKILGNDNGVSFHLFNKTTLGPRKPCCPCWGALSCSADWKALSTRSYCLSVMSSFC